MAKEILTEELWAVMEPLLPPPLARPKGGRPRIPDRAVLTGIIFVLKRGWRGKIYRRRWAVEVG